MIKFFSEIINEPEKMPDWLRGRVTYLTLKTK